MMKKISRLAALFAATALLFGAIGCDDGGSSGDGNSNNGDGDTYAWDFAAADLADLATETSTDANTSGKPKIPAESYYESTPAGLTLILPAGGVFNKIDSTTSNSKVSSIGASKGAIEPSKGSDLTVKVKGPFTAVMLCGANSDSDKTDRYAYIKADGEEVAAPSKESNTLKGSGESLTYAYEGTDEVTLAFGVSSGYVRIYDIKITTENGDGDGKTAGEVTSSASFEAQSTTVANNEDTLGLVGTSATSSDDTVVMAEVSGENIVIKSVKAGTATITVKDESGEKTATIKATVNGAGKITKTVTKYRAPGEAGTYTLQPSDIMDWTTAKTGLTNITTTGAKFQAGEGVTYDASKIGVPSIKLGGSAQKAGKNCIVLTTTSDNVAVTVKFAANGSSATDGRHLIAIAGTTTSAVSSGSVAEGAIEDTTNVPTESNGIVTASITLPTAGTYSIGGTNGIYITEVSLTM